MLELEPAILACDTAVSLCSGLRLYCWFIDKFNAEFTVLSTYFNEMFTSRRP